MQLTKLPVGACLTISGDNEIITWEKTNNGKFNELIRKHTINGVVKSFSEPIGIYGYSKAEEELDFRLEMLGWTIQPN